MKPLIALAILSAVTGALILALMASGQDEWLDDRPAAIYRPETIVHLQPRQEVVDWDLWHARFVSYLRQYVGKEGLANGWPESHYVRLRVVINRSRVVVVSILGWDNQAAAGMLKDALQDLSGNPVLEFPPNSRRAILSFERTYTVHHGNLPGFGYGILPIQGDREIIINGRLTQPWTTMAAAGPQQIVLTGY